MSRVWHIETIYSVLIPENWTFVFLFLSSLAILPFLRGGARGGALDGGSPVATLDFKNCFLSLILNISCRF